MDLGVLNIYKSQGGTVSIPAATAVTETRIPTFSTGVDLGLDENRYGIGLGAAIQVGVQNYLIQQIRDDGSIRVKNRENIQVVIDAPFTISYLPVKRGPMQAEVVEFDKWTFNTAGVSVMVAQFNPLDWPALSNGTL